MSFSLLYNEWMVTMKLELYYYDPPVRQKGRVQKHEDIIAPVFISKRLDDSDGDDGFLI